MYLLKNSTRPNFELSANSICRRVKIELTHDCPIMSNSGSRLMYGIVLNCQGCMCFSLPELFFSLLFEKRGEKGLSAHPAIVLSVTKILR